MGLATLLDPSACRISKITMSVAGTMTRLANEIRDLFREFCSRLSARLLQTHGTGFGATRPHVRPSHVYATSRGARDHVTWPVRRTPLSTSRPNDGDDVAGGRIDDQYFIADHDVVEAAPFRDDVDGVYGQRI